MESPMPPPTLLRSSGKSIGDVHPDAAAIVIYESVLEAVLNYSETDLHRELGGFLIGRTFDEPQSLVEVRRFLPAASVRHDFASVTFTHDTWAALTREVEQKFPQEAVVGWHHTHPGFGIFLSSHDLFVHRHFFSAAWQVAMVVDPRRTEFGFFQWRGGEIVDCGFLCVED